MFQKIAKHRANDASNDVHRPPLGGGLAQSKKSLSEENEVVKKRGRGGLSFFTKSKKTVFYTSPKADSERGDADGRSEVSIGADNLGFEGQQPTSANERVNQNANHLSGSIVCLAKLLNRTFVIALFEFYITPFTLRISILLYNHEF